MIRVRHKETGEALLDWPGDTLAGAELPNAVLLYADLQGVNLAGANLRGADLCQADLRDAVLDGANLAGADVTLANLAGASFRNAILADARLQAVTLDLSGPARTDFRGAELDPGQPQELEPVGSTFADAEMRRIDLTHVDLSGSDLSGANLTEANFSYSTAARRRPELLDAGERAVQRGGSGGGLAAAYRSHLRGAERRRADGCGLLVGAAVADA